MSLAGLQSDVSYELFLHSLLPLASVLSHDASFCIVVLRSDLFRGSHIGSLLYSCNRVYSVVAAVVAFQALGLGSFCSILLDGDDVVFITVCRMYIF